ncbi:hypothetical protein DPMN_033885 [Dreissena polymorpha]|uniref:Uncharacterized protein n=1 Tax=Dreissena polymorpha TaxID=45954 RepID=A0A9D4M6I0_DREPO|nr:hypothetical protein DPMN_033885 [Dreissena polymorpha]
MDITILPPLYQNVTFKVLTRINSLPPCGHVFQQTDTIFKHIQYIIKTNVLTKFHDGWAINVTFRVLISFYYSHIRKNALPPDIIGTNLLTKFQLDWKLNVASRVLTRKNAQPPGGHVFQATGTIFELVQEIIGTNCLTKFHDDRTINVASIVLTRFYYSHIHNRPEPCTTNVLTKSREDWTINVTLRPIKEKCPPHSGHVFKATGTILNYHEHIALKRAKNKTRDKIVTKPGFQFEKKVR